MFRSSLISIYVRMNQKDLCLFGWKELDLKCLKSQANFNFFMCLIFFIPL